MLTPNNLYSNIDEICPSWVRFHFRQNMQNSAGRNISSTTTSLIFVQPLNNVINSSYLRPNFFALCLAVKDDLDIVEWIEYHWRKGCSNFQEYIYCGRNEAVSSNAYMKPSTGESTNSSDSLM